MNEKHSAPDPEVTGGDVTSALVKAQDCLC